MIRIPAALRRLATHADGEEGQVLILVATLMVSMLGFSGLVLDYGQASNKHRQAQNAADAAAQGAAYAIYAGGSETDGTTTANALMPQHGYTTANLTTLQYLDAAGQPTSNAAYVTFVHSRVAETFRTLLMGLLGVSTASVSATATVKIGPVSAPCAFCVLDPSAANALQETGNGNATVTGGGVLVNSDDSTAATNLTGNAQVTAPTIGIVGGYTTTGNARFNNGGPGIAPTTGIKAVLDPLAHVVDPLSSGQCGINLGSVSVSGPQTLLPGTYGSISVSGGGSLTLQPGVYCITGAFSASGSATIRGTGVMLYFTCGTSPMPMACAGGGQNGGSFSLTGNGAYNISAPPSGTYQGLSIFYDRHNTAGFSMTGNGTDAYAGTIYAKSAGMTLTGNGSTFQLNSMIICGTATLTGNGSLSIAYTQAGNYQIPQMPVFTQ